MFATTYRYLSVIDRNHMENSQNYGLIERPEDCANVTKTTTDSKIVFKDTKEAAAEALAKAEPGTSVFCGTNYVGQRLEEDAEIDQTVKRRKL